METTFVQLGRMGDILNILPAIKFEYESSGEKPNLVVCKEFLSLIEGLSYLNPHGVDLPYGNTRSASHFAQARIGGKVVVTQVYSTDGIHTDIKTPCFLFDSWAKANCPKTWGSLPLVLDNRNPQKEQELKDRLVNKEGNPYVLVFASGVSSPFPYGGDLAAALRTSLEGFQILDMSNVRAERFQDLLKLMDDAHCIVSIDTGALHLAYATKTPVVALINSNCEWEASAWRPQHIKRVKYSDFYAKKQEIVESVRNAKSFKHPKLIHAWSDFRASKKVDENTAKRLSVARQTWQIQYDTGFWVGCEVTRDQLTRDAITELGDTRDTPFLRDIISKAYELANPKDIIVLTNSDTCMVPSLTGSLIDKVTAKGAAFAHRWDFGKLHKPLLSECYVTNGNWYAGSDLFAFTKEWWDHNGHRLPDMVIGCEKWDEVMRQLVKATGGCEIHKSIYHEKHENQWENPLTRASIKGNRHNVKLANQWSLQTGYQDNDWIWWVVK